jgi:hypothetical protein
MNGEFLSISGGSLDFNPMFAGITFHSMATLSGQLDCATNELDIKVDNGMSVVPFYGTMKGQLDRLTGTIAGNWTLTVGTDPSTPGFISCTGPWSAVKQ